MALAEVVGVSIGGFVTLAVVLQAFRAVNGKALMTTRRDSSLPMKNIRNKSLERLTIGMLGFGEDNGRRDGL